MEISFKKIFKRKKFFLLFLFSIVFIFSTIDLNAHPAKKHKPMVCILEEDRTEAQKRTCRQWLFIHRLWVRSRLCNFKIGGRKRNKKFEDQLEELLNVAIFLLTIKQQNTKVYQNQNQNLKLLLK